MNFRYIKKKAALFLLVLMLGMGTFSGCGNDTKVVFTTGLSGNQVFKIGSMTCTMPEVMVYLTTFYNQYVQTYGEEMWKHDFGGVSLEEYVKDVVINKMAQIKTMNLMAEKYQIHLTKEEKEKISQAAEAYFKVLPETLKKKENITKKTVETVYKEYTIANKVYAAITESADLEISDDEARTVTVQMLFFKGYQMKDGQKVPMEEAAREQVLKRAEEAWQQISLGESFEAVGGRYQGEYESTKAFARGDVDDYFEERLFALDEGECSEVIQTSEGFYIVRCISTMDYEATQKNKLVLAEKRKHEAFSKAYSEVAKDSYSQFRSKLWDKVSLDVKIHTTDADFFEIYEKYIKE